MSVKWWIFAPMRISEHRAYCSERWPWVSSCSTIWEQVREEEPWPTLESPRLSLQEGGRSLELDTGGPSGSKLPECGSAQTWETLELWEPEQLQLRLLPALPSGQVTQTSERTQGAYFGLKSVVPIVRTNTNQIEEA